MVTKSERCDSDSIWSLVKHTKINAKEDAKDCPFSLNFNQCIYMMIA